MKSLKNNKNKVKHSSPDKISDNKIDKRLYDQLTWHQEGVVHLINEELFEFPEEQIIKSFQFMNKTHKYFYLIYTLHMDRVNVLTKKIKWGKNIGLVTNVHEGNLEHIKQLKSCKAKVKLLIMDDKLLQKHPEYNLIGLRVHLPRTGSVLIVP